MRKTLFLVVDFLLFLQMVISYDLPGQNSGSGELSDEDGVSGNNTAGTDAFDIQGSYSGSGQYNHSGEDDGHIPERREVIDEDLEEESPYGVSGFFSEDSSASGRVLIDYERGIDESGYSGSGQKYYWVEDDALISGNFSEDSMMVGTDSFYSEDQFLKYYHSDEDNKPIDGGINGEVLAGESSDNNLGLKKRKNSAAKHVAKGFRSIGNHTINITIEDIEANTVSRSNGEGNDTIANNIILKKPVVLCGLPSYNNRKKCETQSDGDTLAQCEHQGGALVFGFIIGSIGVAIICANCLVPIAMWKSQVMRTKFDYIKVSLAVADLLSGIILLADVLPNIIRFRGFSYEEAVEFVFQDINSPSAITTGSLLSMSLQASLLHLVFMSIERFSAIQWPFWYRTRKTSSVAATLVVIWIVSILCSFGPAVSPYSLEYQFQPELLLHWMILKSRDGGIQDYAWQGYLYAVLTVLLPFFVMVVFCISTAAVSYRKLTAFDRKYGQGGEVEGQCNRAVGRERKRQLRPEISVFITVVIMITVFTVTLLPFTIVVALIFNDFLDCKNYTIPYVVSFYIGISNSLANPVLYTIRDERFRKSLRQVLCSSMIFRKRN